MAMCGFGVTCASVDVGFANVMKTGVFRVDVKCGILFTRKRFFLNLLSLRREASANGDG
jgi:hypothetical protein